jgi:SAM-dependent methyltransferase
MSKVRYTKRNYCFNKKCRNENFDSNLKKMLSLNDHESNLGIFDILFCEKCRMGYTDPYPTADTAHILYESKDSSDFDIGNRNFIDFIKDYLSVQTLKKIAGPKVITHFLDFSTGNGRYAIGASKAFPKAIIHAVDYSNIPPLSIIENKSNITYFSSNEFADVKINYDFIFLRHVLEHSHDPVSLIKKLGSLLNPDGILYIEVPNLDSGCARIFKNHWMPFYVPRHIFHFTEDSLSNIICESNLDFKIGRNEAPLMGNTFAILTGINKAKAWVKIVGIFLHPLQILIEKLYGSSSCIHAICKKKA